MIEIRYVEDLHVLAPWLREILRIHGMDERAYGLSGLRKPVRLVMHQRLADGTEADLIITNGDKTVAIELKDTNTQVYDQAIARRKWYDYVYAALNWPTSEILAYLAAKPSIIEAGIGVVSLRDNIVVVRAYKRSSNPNRIAKLVEYMGENNA